MVGLMLWVGLWLQLDGWRTILWDAEPPGEGRVIFIAYVLPGVCLTQFHEISGLAGGMRSTECDSTVEDETRVIRVRENFCK